MLHESDKRDRERRIYRAGIKSNELKPSRCRGNHRSCLGAVSRVLPSRGLSQWSGSLVAGSGGWGFEIALLPGGMLNRSSRPGTAEFTSALPVGYTFGKSGSSSAGSRPCLSSVPSSSSLATNTSCMSRPARGRPVSVGRPLSGICPFHDSRLHVSDTPLTDGRLGSAKNVEEMLELLHSALDVPSLDESSEAVGLSVYACPATHRKRKRPPNIVRDELVDHAESCFAPVSRHIWEREQELLEIRKLTGSMRERTLQLISKAEATELSFQKDFCAQPDSDTLCSAGDTCLPAIGTKDCAGSSEANSPSSAITHDLRSPHHGSQGLTVGEVAPNLSATHQGGKGRRNSRPRSFKVECERQEIAPLSTETHVSQSQPEHDASPPDLRNDVRQAGADVRPSQPAKTSNNGQAKPEAKERSADKAPASPPVKRSSEKESFARRHSFESPKKSTAPFGAAKAAKANAMEWGKKAFDISAGHLNPRLGESKTFERSTKFNFSGKDNVCMFSVYRHGVSRYLRIQVIVLPHGQKLEMIVDGTHVEDLLFHTRTMGGPDSPYQQSASPDSPRKNGPSSQKPLRTSATGGRRPSLPIDNETLDMLKLEQLVEVLPDEQDASQASCLQIAGWINPTQRYEQRQKQVQDDFAKVFNVHKDITDSEERSRFCTFVSR